MRGHASNATTDVKFEQQPGVQAEPRENVERLIDGEEKLLGDLGLGWGRRKKEKEKAKGKEKGERLGPKGFRSSSTRVVGGNCVQYCSVQ